MRPPIDPRGTAVANVVVVAPVTSVGLMLCVTRLFASVASKFVPATVNGVPATPIDGVRPVIVGASPPPATTVKAEALVAEPAGATTPRGPVVAPGGTMATSCVAFAALTDAAAPLNVTMFSAGNGEKPDPATVTAAPMGPRDGVKPLIAVGLLPPLPGRSIARMLPRVSYR